MEVVKLFRKECMIKEWKNMSPEQKRTEKFAIVVMSLIIVAIALLFLMAGGLA